MTPLLKPPILKDLRLYARRNYMLGYFSSPVPDVKFRVLFHLGAERYIPAPSGLTLTTTDAEAYAIYFLAAMRGETNVVSLVSLRRFTVTNYLPGITHFALYRPPA
jgi:hypothetical protein